MLETLESAVTALARMGYMPEGRFNTTLSPPMVLIVSDPPELTNDNQSVAVGKFPVDDPSAKARLGALEGEAIAISKKRVPWTAAVSSRRDTMLLVCSRIAATLRRV